MAEDAAARPARESDLTIHDQDFSMVAEIDLNTAAQRIERQERTALATGGTKRPQRPAVQSARAHRVIEKANLDAGPRPFRERIEK